MDVMARFKGKGDVEESALNLFRRMGQRKRRYGIVALQCSDQCPPLPLSAFTSSPTTALASPKSMYVRSPKYSSFSMPAKPGFILRLMAKHVRALSASMMG